MTHLVWFRADLRTHDNPALSDACARARESQSPVIALYTICPDQWDAHDWADIRVNFILRNLRELSSTLAELNIPLLIRECPDFSGVPDLIADLIREHRCASIHFNHEYEINEAERDQQVLDNSRTLGCASHTHHDQCVIRPGLVKTQQDAWYTVFTPFKKRWLEIFADDERHAVGAPKPISSKINLRADAIPDRVRGFDASRDRPDLWPAGERAAMERLSKFIASKIDRYDELRDRPDLNATSTLSPYLASGVVSIRRCMEAAIQANAGSPPDPKAKVQSGPAVWISELIWREFYRHLLVGFPRLCKHQPFQAETRKLKWRTADEDFSAWCEGRTGIPIVDAAMRQLLRTGWMHNRLRMVVAMFLTKNLFIDWRRGERFFMQHLIDGDLASNNGGWQWSASTGTDAAPYFRIFNPISQAKRFDPDGEFVRALVPELAEIEGAAIHEPWSMPPLLSSDRGYPEPICDLSKSRQRAIDAFKSLK